MVHRCTSIIRQLGSQYSFHINHEKKWFWGHLQTDFDKQYTVSAKEGFGAPRTFRLYTEMSVDTKELSCGDIIQGENTSYRIVRIEDFVFDGRALYRKAHVFCVGKAVA